MLSLPGAVRSGPAGTGCSGCARLLWQWEEEEEEEEEAGGGGGSPAAALLPGAAPPDWMTGDNSHCTKTAHVKREGRESQEEKKKKGKQKIKKTHYKRLCCLVGRDAVPSCPTHTPAMQKFTLRKGHPYPALPPAKRGAHTHQGHPHPRVTPTLGAPPHQGHPHTRGTPKPRRRAMGASQPRGRPNIGTAHTHAWPRWNYC